MQISKGGIWRIIWSVFNSHPQPPSATISNVPHILPGNVKFRIWNNTSIFRLICWDLGTVLCCRRTCSIARLERNSCLDWPDGNEELTYARIVDRDAWDRSIGSFGHISLLFAEKQYRIRFHSRKVRVRRCLLPTFRVFILIDSPWIMDSLREFIGLPAMTGKTDSHRRPKGGPYRRSEL